MKKQLSDEFEMKDLSAAKKILRMEITRNKSIGKLFLSQQAYVEKVLKRFNMNNAKPMTIPFAAHFKLFANMSSKIDEEMEHMSHIPYSSVVGSILYAIVCTRPNISHAVSIGTTDVSLTFNRTKVSDSVIGYIDSDFVRDLDKRRFLTSYLFTLSGSVISWKTILQAIVALSTIEAEYMTLVETVKEAL
ncbi:hypothetical protein GH714_037815 [Hevea brasiliensis]|uniref:Reverse transcriptase Ty1/copia-type domain-containing protein n=1 Tax=Hevea brasiliensis TaxID=3981 RepID=A0A6A6NAK5_HEVBR|nr:hypothetical protein GH714_037815 [Hevea brasiliensis]